MAFAKYKGTQQWQPVTNYREPFAAEKGILDYMIEKMQAKYPNIEYITQEVKTQ
jgi:hypothetical protein